MQWTDESIAFLRDAAAMNRYYETIAEKIAPQLPENAHGSLPPRAAASAS